MLVAVTGASGLIGSALSRRLTGEGHRVLRLVRGEPNGPDQARWDPAGGTIDAKALAGADAVVHLAGRNIAGALWTLAGSGIGGFLWTLASSILTGGVRWTPGVKRDILDSRVRGTSLLAGTLAELDGPRVLVCASGIDYYGDRGGEALTEASPSGDSFLAEVCRRWEAAADPARAAGLRVVHVRTGLVQTAEGGALAVQLPLFRLGLGGRLGTGRQWWSWVALDDVVGIYRHALLDERASGPLNATAPSPVTNAEHAATLARVLGRPAFAHVPAFGPRLALGRQLADELLFSSKRALPTATLASGYRFRYDELEPALRHLLARPAA
jgi:uncharacterized protein (TIGR01777 family)